MAEEVKPTPESYENLIDPKDLRIYSVKSSDAQRYREAGWSAPDPTPKVDRAVIDQPIMDWKNTGKAVLFQALRGVPFGVTGLEKVVDRGTFEDLSHIDAQFEEDHPVLAPAISIGSGIATTAAAGGLLGLGGRLLGAAGGTVGGMAGTVAKGAQAVADLIPGGATGRLAVRGALGGAALGQVYRYDNAAIEHAVHPAGQEKLTISANDVLWDAALGAAVPVGLRGLGKLLGKTGKAVTEQGFDMRRNAMMKESALKSIEKQGRGADFKQYFDSMIGLSPEEVLNKTQVDVGLANQGMNIIKSRYNAKGAFLSNASKTDLLQQVGTIINDNDDPVLKEIQKRVLGRSFGLQQMQYLTDHIRKNIVWNGEWEVGSANQRYRDAYLKVVNAGADLIKNKQPAGSGDLEKWISLNQQYSNASLVSQGMKGGAGQGMEDVLRSAVAAGLTGGAMSMAGITTAGIGSAASRAAGWSAVHHVKAQHIGPFAVKLGKVFTGIDKRIGDAIEASLYGLPEQVHKFRNPLRFDDAAATISLAASDPAKLVERTQQVLNDQDVPQEMSIPISQKQAAGILHLHKSRPVRNDAPDMTTASQGDPVQNHRWLDQVRTFQDPTYGLTHPTANNMMILKQFFPETLFAAQQAAHLVVSRDPNLPLESKVYASKLLERPISNLTSPTFAAALAKARQGADQAAQPKGPSGNKPQTAVQSSLSRADALQNRD